MHLHVYSNLSINVYFIIQITCIHIRSDQIRIIIYICVYNYYANYLNQSHTCMDTGLSIISFVFAVITHYSEEGSIPSVVEKGWSNGSCNADTAFNIGNSSYFSWNSCPFLLTITNYISYMVLCHLILFGLTLWNIAIR